MEPFVPFSLNQNDISKDGKSYELCPLPGKGLDSSKTSALKASFRTTKSWVFFKLCPILRLKCCVAENSDLFFPCSELHPGSAREDEHAVGILFPI